MQEPFPYLIEQWSTDEQRIVHTIATADDAEVDRTAFARAVRTTGDAPITLRHGPKVLVARWSESRRRARRG